MSQVPSLGAAGPRSYPIVGMHFRPPAKGLMGELPAGQTLHIVPEPSNPYDPFALAVFVLTSDLPQGPDGGLAEDLVNACIGYGYGEAELSEQAAWQLGYLARDLVRLEENHTCKLGFDAKGKPLATDLQEEPPEDLPEAPL